MLISFFRTKNFTKAVADISKIFRKVHLFTFFVDFYFFENKTLRHKSAGFSFCLIIKLNKREFLCPSDDVS